MQQPVSLSVIIATKDRADALRDISLPSLLRQDTDGFEVIVWDASETDDSRVVAESFAPRFAERGINFTFAKAPRAGLTSQRNDAVKSARGGGSHLLYRR